MAAVDEDRVVRPVIGVVLPVVMIDVTAVVPAVDMVAHVVVEAMVAMRGAAVDGEDTTTDAETAAVTRTAEEEAAVDTAAVAMTVAGEDLAVREEVLAEVDTQTTAGTEGHHCLRKISVKCHWKIRIDRS